MVSLRVQVAAAAAEGLVGVRVPGLGGGSAEVGADRLLTADEDELTAHALGAHRKLVGP